MSKIYLIRAIKAAPDGFTFYNPDYPTKNWLELLSRMECITLRVNYSADVRSLTWRAIYNAPKSTPPANEKLILVSHWHADRVTGERVGKYAQVAA